MVTVSNERDFLSLSPQSLQFWESLSLEPFSQPRDIVYFVLTPDNEFLLNNVKGFFKNLSQEYEVSPIYVQYIPDMFSYMLYELKSQ